jgi:hypothetical protein
MPPKKKQNGGMINFYELPECQAFEQKYHNPCYNFETMPLKHPFQMCIVGCSGSGKSNILLNIIQKMSNTFEYIRIFTQNKDEQLYNFLSSKIEKPFLEIYEGIQSIEETNIDELEDAQYLFIYDDMCIEKEQKQDNIKGMYVRGRKLAQRQGVSNIYLSQSYYQIPPIVRKQMNCLILKKINGKRDINSILRECSLNADKEQLQNIYDYCVKSKEDITNCLFIDFGASDEARFRKNFDEILDINKF